MPKDRLWFTGYSGRDQSNRGRAGSRDQLNRGRQRDRSNREGNARWGGGGGLGFVLQTKLAAGSDSSYSSSSSSIKGGREGSIGRAACNMREDLAVAAFCVTRWQTWTCGWSWWWWWRRAVWREKTRFLTNSAVPYLDFFYLCASEVAGGLRLKGGVGPPPPPSHRHCRRRRRCCRCRRSREGCGLQEIEESSLTWTFLPLLLEVAGGLACKQSWRRARTPPPPPPSPLCRRSREVGVRWRRSAWHVTRRLTNPTVPYLELELELKLELELTFFWPWTCSEVMAAAVGSRVTRMAGSASQLVSSFSLSLSLFLFLFLKFQVFSFFETL